ncbi:MAG: DNA repair protein RadC [Candidatus Dadabacteria bacterium]|nr:DNA repair protein RadC [Candidatus Dadabacteria bacterium]NIS09027.1 DNA repair protein RadC [Candidatus Dadabacteria bacterium]NIX15621.1 DNA repair protein RadC [Candidatus Dadabacteria bacterium]NIY22363.1 DNA repair protein RadC [Candidatus Dadabacteria bacterium]
MVKGDALSSPDAVADFAKAGLSGLKDEVFLCILVNTKNEVIDYEVIQEGTIDQVVLHPRKVLEQALNKKASGIILVHNHPSGHAEPSRENKALTKEMIKTAELINLRILDHLVIGSNSYYSFRENSLI